MANVSALKPPLCLACPGAWSCAVLLFESTTSRLDGRPADKRRYGQPVAFLDDTDVSTDDLLESVPLNQDEANAVEEGTLEEINVDADDIEYLKTEFGVDYF